MENLELTQEPQVPEILSNEDENRDLIDRVRNIKKNYLDQTEKWNIMVRFKNNV